MVCFAISSTKIVIAIPLNIQAFAFSFPLSKLASIYEKAAKISAFRAGAFSAFFTRGGGGGGGTSGPADETHPDLTFLMYLCGSDLETGGAEGTGALLRMMYGYSRTPKDQADRMNVLICAGGSAGWKAPYLYSYLNEQKHNTAVYTLNYEELAKRFSALQAGTAELPISSEKQKELISPDPEAPDSVLNIFKLGQYV